MNSPFKFLDAYKLSDRQFFFGREKEIEALYEMVFDTPLLLVYGESGTGKTSLIQCGLASCFDGPDWYPIFIRKQENINQSLRQAINKELGEFGQMNGNLTDGVSQLFRYYLRPVYLIFDQFEELFILGETAEQEELASQIQQLILSELPCKVIFVMREEFFPALYDFEKKIPSLFDFRLRVEPMNTARVKEVMQSSFNQFNIRLDGDQDARLQEMIDNISGEKSGIQLPYLQVYLDMLYREDYKRTYGTKAVAEKLPELVFTADEIEQMGKIEEVLDKFLREQEADLELELKAIQANLPEKPVRLLLDIFVTEEGTKRPIYYRRENETLRLFDPFSSQLEGLSPQVITKGLTSLEQRRLLRFSDDTVELAHDTLAKLIDEQRSDEQRALNEAKKRLNAAYNDFKHTQQYLTKKQLDRYEDIIPQLNLKKEVLQFVVASREDANRLEAAEQTRQKKELRRTRQFLAAVSVVAIVALFAGWYALQQSRLAQDKTLEVQMQAFESQIANGRTFRVQGQYAQALEQIEAAKEFAITDELKKKRKSIAQKWKSLFALLSEADTLNVQKYQSQWPTALKLYQQAAELDHTDPQIQTKIDLLENNIQIAFEDLYNRAININNFVPCNNAVCVLFKQALQLQPDNAKAIQELKKCPNCR